MSEKEVDHFEKIWADLPEDVQEALVTLRLYEEKGAAWPTLICDPARGFFRRMGGAGAAKKEYIARDEAQMLRHTSRQLIEMIAIFYDAAKERGLTESICELISVEMLKMQMNTAAQQAQMDRLQSFQQKLAREMGLGLDDEDDEE